MLGESLTFVAALVLGLTFVVSGLSKLHDWRGFARGMLSYDVLPPRVTRLVGVCLPPLELGTGFCLVTGYLLPVAAGVAFLMLAVFALVVTILVVTKHDVDCHCFGGFSSSRVGWHTLARDLTLLGVAIRVLRSALVTGGDTLHARLAEDPAAAGASLMLALALALACLWVFDAVGLLTDLLTYRPSGRSSDIQATEEP